MRERRCGDARDVACSPRYTVPYCMLQFKEGHTPLTTREAGCELSSTRSGVCEVVKQSGVREAECDSELAGRWSLRSALAGVGRRRHTLRFDNLKSGYRLRSSF